MTMYNTPSDLRSLFDEAKTKYADFRSIADESVKRTTLTSELLFSFRPGFDELIAEQNNVASTPPSQKQAYQYGFDETERPCFLRHLGQTGDNVGEDFFEYGENVVIQRSFSADAQKNLVSVSVYVLENHSMSKFLSLSANGVSIFEVYTYKNGNLDTLRRRISKPESDVTYFHEYSGSVVSQIWKKDMKGEKILVYSLKKN